MHIPFHKAYITDEEINLVVDALRSGWITMGPKVMEFEKKFADFINKGSSKQIKALLVNSCTAALHLALKSIGLKAGDEVILPTNTFIATAEVVTYFNAKPVMCDIDYDTMLMDVNKLEALITDKTKAIIPVHFAGQPCDMDEILDIARRYNLKVIEDAAHSFPAFYKDKAVGTIGDITCFSFYATKTLAMGEGGAITTDNEEYLKSIKINRLHGINRDAWDRYTMKGSWYYEVVDNGLKYNSTDINAALGLAQLNKAEWMMKEREKIAKMYIDAFKGDERIGLPVVKDDRISAWHLFVIKVKNRNHLIEKLKEVGVGTSVHFIPVHKHPYYRNNFGYNDSDYPVANRVFELSLSLPIWPGMKDEEVEYVVDMVKRYA
ncbi:DegT/DnrJ/EryC1/StrS family aminotransferase [Calditerrivibrio nitroreducens]|uniref:DegT/DnrJ/EryC1/StrS aminotransferase n=1 Tax=Calditerrivibrio nitroreducens (strain DSM 19672 / NBRC 101217 / Yu37-1) TaxID=768670 RepID=E4TGB5_CALNY|nr:DegT/DnrJ/EryC1/StrS family aminotransferase [Calditerrivibrio nitroreducens]ADR19702.1 DegT/DnrJ/EryC1/StrS aminotransferase [Calditerrivibrio nitroreducens DSM 19672]